jgi:RNA polymerase sigma factor (sigma-70 family)
VPGDEDVQAPRTRHSARQVPAMFLMRPILNTSAPLFHSDDTADIQIVPVALHISAKTAPYLVRQDVQVTDERAEALERLYREDGERLYRAVLAYAGDPGVADDAVAEAFAQALRNQTQLRDPASWVWAVAFRVAKGELARRRRDVANIGEPSYEMPESMQDLLSALATLSPKQRASVVLHHFAGYSVRETARMVDSTSAAVRVHLSQGRKRLRAWLDEETADV